MNPDFLDQLVEAADTVASVLAANPLRGTGLYPIGEILPVLTDQHEAIRQAVKNHPGPIGLNQHGKQSTLAMELAGLASLLQLLQVLYHQLDDLPPGLRANANRHLSTTHLTARRLRDHARSYRPPETSTEVPVM